MTAYVFVGPSLPDAAPAVGSGITVLPPVAAGDLLRLPVHPGDLVGIIDGYFHHARAVRHKEILDVLRRGVPVLGASSMGALRAAELDEFGMQGVGRIYADYAAGILDADDEVALMHGPAESGYKQLSEPLVNIRATLEAATEAQACSAEAAESLVANLAALPYPRRTFRQLIAVGKDLGMDAGALADLEAFCAANKVDRKRSDALVLVDALRCQRPGPPTIPAGRRVNRSLFLYAWQLDAQQSDAEQSDGAESAPLRVSDLAVLRACQLFAADYSAFYRQLVLGWLVQECGASGHVEPAELAGDEGSLVDRAIAHGAHEGIYAPEVCEDPPDFLATWVSPSERMLPPRDQVERFLVRSFRVAPGISWDELPLATLREHPVFAAGRRVVQLAGAVNTEVTRRNPEFDIDSLSAERIRGLFAARWGVDSDNLEYAALDRGFDSLAAVVAAARLFYLLARYNPDRVDLRLGAPARSG